MLPFIAVVGAVYRRMWDYAVRKDASTEDAVEEEYPVLNEALKSTEATFNDALKSADETLMKRLTSDEAPAPAPGMMERVFGKKEAPKEPGLLDSIMGDAAPAPAPAKK